MKDNIKREAELDNLKTIMFDNYGNLIRGEISIAEIIDLLKLKDKYKTIAAYDGSKVISADCLNTMFNGSLEKTQLQFENSEQNFDCKKNIELPALILFLPKNYSYVQS